MSLDRFNNTHGRLNETFRALGWVAGCTFPVEVGSMLGVVVKKYSHCDIAEGQRSNVDRGSLIYRFNFVKDLATAGIVDGRITLRVGHCRAPEDTPQPGWFVWEVLNPDKLEHQFPSDVTSDERVSIAALNRELARAHNTPEVAGLNYATRAQSHGCKVKKYHLTYLPRLPSFVERAA